VSDREHRYAALIWNAARDHNIPYALLKEQVRQESNFLPLATSRSGAMGLLQIMPATAEDLGLDDPWDPAQNLDAGAWYLRSRYDVFLAEEPRLERWRYALAAYNAGTGYVLEAQREAKRRGLPTTQWCYLAPLYPSLVYGGRKPDWVQVCHYVATIVDRWLLSELEFTSGRNA